MPSLCITRSCCMYYQILVSANVGISHNIWIISQLKCEANFLLTFITDASSHFKAKASIVFTVRKSV